MILSPGGLGGLCLLSACAFALAQQPAAPSAEAIMARVAANQDRAEQERAHYLYVQHARVISRKGSTVMCEEITDTRITPSPTGSQAALLKLNGRLLQKHQYLTYTELPANPAALAKDDHSLNVSLGDDTTDRDLVENMRANLLHDRSRDGLDARLFPLTTTNQAGYLFHLQGREQRNGRDVFHITFKPKQKDDYDWQGDAYIDAAAYYPVVIRTDLAHKVPLAVRTLLGTNVPGLGFTVVYAPQPDGVWFPVSFGTEFKIHVLFFFTRQIIVDAQNTAFEKTHTGATIVDSAEQPTP